MRLIAFIILSLALSACGHDALDGKLSPEERASYSNARTGVAGPVNVELLYIFGGRGTPYRERGNYRVRGDQFQAFGWHSYRSDSVFLLPNIGGKRGWVRVTDARKRVLTQRRWFRLRTSLRIPGRATATCYPINGTTHYPAPLWNCYHEWQQW